MKNILFTIGFVIFWVNCIAQTTRSPTPGFSPSSNQTFVNELGIGSFRNGAFMPRYTDTTQANTFIYKDTTGNVIFTYSTMSLWVRAVTGVTKYWKEVGSGGGGGSGTVTTVSVATANGFAGSVANATTTPAITISTTITGILKGNGTAISAATPGTDYLTVLTGDVTTSGNAATLATVNSNVGSFGASTSIPSFTVNAKGLITAVASNVVIAPAGTLTGTTLAANVVTSSLTAVGTIVTGTWSATTIATTVGGTGLTSYTTGDMLYASASNVLSKRAIGADGFVLTVSGGVPIWAAIPDNNIVILNAGTGQQSWYENNDTLYMKKHKNSTFISWTTDTDSSLVGSLSATGTPSSSTYLRGDNTWATVSGGGDVTKVGTPVNNQLGVWTGDGTIEGDPALLFSAGTLTVGLAGTTLGSLVLSGNTAQTVTIRTLATAGNYTLTLPADDGTSNQFLQTNGSGTLTWATASGSGDVTKVGTPVNNQVGVWTGDGTIEGDANLTFSSATLSLGVAGAATGKFTQSGVTSGTITFQPASAAGTYTLTWPTTDGGANEFLQTDGNGVLTWAAGGSGANTALSNLAAVAINTSLLSDADVTDDLGDGTHNWLNLWVRNINFDGSTSGTTALLATAAAGSTTITLPAATGTVALLSGTQTFTGITTFSNNLFATSAFYLNATPDNANFAVNSSSSIGTAISTSAWQLGGSTNVQYRMGSRGSTAGTLTASVSYAHWILGNTGLSEAATGTHPILAAFAIKASTFTNGAGASTNVTSLYIEGAPTGITPTNPATALWVAGGTARFDGNLTIGGTVVAASATTTLHLFNGTIPSASVTDGVLMYSEDVAASAELKARDEAGNIATLTPHNFTGIPEGRSEEMSWAFYSERDGKYVNVDMLKLARAVEKITGEKLVYIGSTKEKPNPKNK